MTGDPADSCTIRLARQAELPRLTEIELDAFVTLADARGIGGEAHVLPQDALRQSLQASLLFVAVDAEDWPMAFLAGREQDGMLYICEIDVARAWQGRGVGRRLMATAIAAASARRLGGVSLTTGRFVPFNAPFYARLGFVEIGEDDALPHLRKTLATEIAGGGGERRMAMILRLV